MANYLYNGVELPEIPASTEGYFGTHAYIILMYGYRLFYSVTPFRSKQAGKINIDYRDEYTDLTDGYWPQTQMWRCNETTRSISDITWSNHDIYDSNGVLVFAASTPVPVSAPGMSITPFDIFMLGQRLRSGLIGVGGKIVGYKYGGVVLPDINTVWTDKETYPHALIISGGGFVRSYILVIARDFNTTRSSSGYVQASSPIGECVYLPGSDDTWGSLRSISDNFLSVPQSCVWSTKTIYRNDGTTIWGQYSKPIPVYSE